MLALTPVTYALPDVDMAPLMRLALLEGQLYATSGAGGALSLWQDGPLLVGVTVPTGAGHRPGHVPGLGTVLGADATPRLLSGGVLYSQDLGTTAALDGPEWISRLGQTETVTLGAAQMVYGILPGGLGALRFEAGALTATAVILDTETTHAARAADLRMAVVGGQRMLISLGGDDPGLTSWRITADGALLPLAHLSPEEGLWIAAPTAMGQATVAGQTYLIVGAAGSSSLSVVLVAADGAMQVVDHVVDDRTARIGGLTALSVVEHSGQTWVVAGGADDGLSLFRLRAGGRLLAEAHLADTLAIGLTDITAVVAMRAAFGLDIFAASEDGGVTHLAVDLGTLGSVGVATAGDDLLVDTYGTETLTGRAGADTFVLVSDGVVDVIADFTARTDRLDLSDWPALRDVSQLDLRMRDDGFEVRYSAERLIVRSADGGPIDPATLPPQHLIATHRLAPQTYVSAGIPPSGDDLRGTAGRDLLQANAGGQQVFGFGDNDLLLGGSGRDWLFGGAGRDRMDAGGGANSLMGGPGNDTYVWRGDRDLLGAEAGYSRGGGIDTVEAWASHTLARNYEILRLQGSTDLDGYGGSAPEVLVGNPGANLLSGGWGADRIVAGAGDDTIIGGPLRDELAGGAGADTFVYAAVTDSRAGRDTRDFINGFEHGRDRIDLSLIDADPTRAGDQAFGFLGARDFTGQAGELIYAAFGGTWNIVSADLDGDRAADFQIFINLTHWMTGTDFIL